MPVRKPGREGEAKAKERVAKSMRTASKKSFLSEDRDGPYQNRHRWAPRGLEGERENCCQGTRQNGPVRSQEGALERAAVKRPKRLFN